MTPRICLLFQDGKAVPTTVDVGDPVVIATTLGDDSARHLRWLASGSLILIGVNDGSEPHTFSCCTNHSLILRGPTLIFFAPYEVEEVLITNIAAATENAPRRWLELAAQAIKPGISEAPNTRELVSIHIPLIDVHDQPSPSLPPELAALFQHLQSKGETEVFEIRDGELVPVGEEDGKDATLGLEAQIRFNRAQNFPCLIDAVGQVAHAWSSGLKENMSHHPLSDELFHKHMALSNAFLDTLADFLAANGAAYDELTTFDVGASEIISGLRSQTPERKH